RAADAPTSCRPHGCHKYMCAHYSLLKSSRPNSATRWTVDSEIDCASRSRAILAMMPGDSQSTRHPGLVHVMMGRSEGCVRRGNPMSNRWYYDIDGRIGGPITPMQLQLMVNSGMLEAHHKIRKEDSSTWNQAGTVRGLFQEPEPAGQPLLGAASAVA